MSNRERLLDGVWDEPAWTPPPWPFSVKRSVVRGPVRDDVEWVVLDASGTCVCVCDDRRVATWIMAGMPGEGTAKAVRELAEAKS